MAVNTIEKLSGRSKGLYPYCVLAGFSTAAALGIAAGNPNVLFISIAIVVGLIAGSLCIAYNRAMQPVRKYEVRQSALRTAFDDVRGSCSSRIEAVYHSSPAARANRLITKTLQLAQDTRDRENARHNSLRLWDKLMNYPVDLLPSLDKKIEQLEQAQQRLLESGALKKTRAFYDARDERIQRRIDALEQCALSSVPHDQQIAFDEQSIAKSALLLSALSVPVSAWNDVVQAGNIYDTLREVNGNFEGMSDFAIWLETLIMPGDSLVGLVSLTKGAYFEKLVEADFGGERFEHFNHPDTDIVIDGIAYQIKATDSASYVESVADEIPVIATSEVAEITRAIDGGYSDDEIEGAVELALGGTVIDLGDTTVDALLTGVGGLGLLATIRGINHGFAKHREGSDPVESALEGAGVAIVGTLEGTVNAAELGYKVVTSKPVRFVGRTGLKVAGAIGRKISGS